ncbi:chorismate lyase [Methylomarinum sp. Ch1-1]|uniref:Probable chorismate pyruvate-lyase n=1 Tax=Methylomarinum roseum TaxID=3067653 RepID=A0AAU7NY82_9GAMM|nr:chorismate lyase [Methylomarinum sp. Ch1-1]MDP4522030.1 chorismate lyase [Methylomarinum sp. Ch1-1]
MPANIPRFNAKVPANSFLFEQEPNWKTNRPGLRHSLPEDVSSWVYEAGSLTRRLRGFYRNSFAVKILFHQWKPAFLSESRQLHLPYQQYNLIREVLLHADGKPLILARTILPKKTINIAKRNLSHLGTRPLGEVIFSYPDLERLQLDISAVPPVIWRPPLREQIDLKHTVWGRRTIYAIQKHPLLVSEFFLPGALEVV